MVVAIDTQFMREVNSAAILSKLRAEETMTVAALASAVGLSRQAVTRSLKILQEAGFVDFVTPEPNASRTGRPAQLVRFRAEAGYVLGIDINPERVRIALADLGGVIVGSCQVAVNGPTAIEVLLKAIDGVLAESDRSNEKVWFASVGIPGVIDPVAGVIKLIPSIPELAGDVLLRALSEHLSCPIYIDNDIKLATQGERSYAVDHDAESFVFVHWGERVGAGIVLNGSLHRGASNDAGDIGFLDLFVDPTDSASSRPRKNSMDLGRFEDWVGAGELVRLAIAAANLAPDLAFVAAIKNADINAHEIVINAAIAGNASALSAVYEAARRFATGIIAIRALIDPTSVVIGGPMARLGDILLAALAKPLDGQPLNQPRLSVSSLGEDAIILGAIRYSLNEIERSSVPYQQKRGEEPLA